MSERGQSKRLTWMHLRMTEKVRIRRGIFNGKYVRLARESRGLTRAQLARKLNIPCLDLAGRESGWHIWDSHLQSGLQWFTNYPVNFFAQSDDEVDTRAGLMFVCGVDTRGEPVCEFVQYEEAT